MEYSLSVISLVIVGKESNRLTMGFENMTLKVMNFHNWNLVSFLLLPHSYHGDLIGVSMGEYFNSAY